MTPATARTEGTSAIRGLLAVVAIYTAGIALLTSPMWITALIGWLGWGWALLIVLAVAAVGGIWVNEIGSNDTTTEDET